LPQYGVDFLQPIPFIPFIALVIPLPKTIGR